MRVPAATRGVTVDEPAESANEPDARGARSIIGALEDARELFASLVDDIRPDLHRYLARMTGSRADGEDLVQDTLARAYYQISEFKELPPLRPWLFRIAHNLAIDHHRRIGYRAAAPLDEAAGVAGDEALRPDSVLARNQAVRLAVASFLAVAPAQRACVILKDVLDHTLDEIADLLGLSVPAVKAALHRGRSLLRQGPASTPDAAPARAATPELQRYAHLFNARDWDGVRALLADDVRLDLVSRRKAAGRREVGVYFSNYERLDDWRLAPAWLDGRAVLAVLPGRGEGPPGYFIELQ